MKTRALSAEEKITIETYEKSPGWWADYFDRGGGWPIELKEFNKYLPAGKVLEIGAGSGRDAKELIKLGYEYTGTEISERFLDIARQTCPGASFIKVSLYDLSFPDKFDGFWASAVLLHVPKSRMDEALGALKDNLKPGAVGFISIKDGEGEKLQERVVEGDKSKRFFAFWRKEEFEKVLKRNGFRTLYYGHRVVTADTDWHMFIVKLK